MIKKEFQDNKPGWTKSFLEGFSQDENGNSLPWMTYSAIEFLERTLNKSQEVFEFGCGASTLFFAKRVKTVTSLETREIWLHIIKQKLCDKGLENSKIFLMEDGLTNELYENFPENSGQKFDLIVVDSLKRFDCAKNSLNALKPGGLVLLDDSERKNYQKIFDFFAEKNFTKLDFPGIAPGQLRRKNTTVFVRKV